MSSRKARPNPSNPARTNQPTQSTHRARRRAASRQSVPSTPAVVILLLTIVGVTVLTAAFRARHSAASDVAQSRAATTAPRAAAPGNAARLSVTPTIAPGQPQWTNDLRVSAYVPDANDGQWQTMPLGQAPNGSEFQYNGQLYSIDAKGGIWAVATITTAQLTEADRTYDPNGSRQPAPGDVVRFVDVQKRHLRHDFVDSFQAGDRFWFQGQLWEVFSGSLLHAGLDLRPAGDILAPAANIRTVPALAHLTLRLADGQGYYNSGPADNTYRVFPDNQMIPAAQLTAGQVIALDNGRQATVLGVQVQQGAFRVYQESPTAAPVAVVKDRLAALGGDPQLARLLDPNEAAYIGLASNSAAAAASSLPTNYLFTGQYYEPGTGLYLMGNRWYDPALGRFIQPDTIVPDLNNPQSLNRYSYVFNQPTRYTDPSGHCPWCIPIGIAALAAAVDFFTVPDTAYAPDLTVDLASLPPSAAPASQHAAAIVGTSLGSYGAVKAGQALIGPTTAACADGDCINELRGAGQAVQNATQSVWRLDPLRRGAEIESRLGGRSPDLPYNFPGIDRFENGIATSMKSIDLGAQTYQNVGALTGKVQGYINELANWQGATWGTKVIVPSQINGRELLLAIPPGATQAQLAALQQLQQWASSVGVMVNVLKFRYS